MSKSIKLKNNNYIDSSSITHNRHKLCDILYPVGSIYLSVNSTNPGTIFGGTWEQLKDRFLLGTGDTYTAGTTGGEATHKLTTSEIPKHQHDVTWANESFGIRNEGQFGSGATSWNCLKLQDISAGTALKAKVQSTGDGAHNNMPPYLVVYMWKRTA